MRTRVLSAIVMLIITLTCILLSPVTRVLFFAAVGILCAYELSVNLEKLNIRCTLWVMITYLVAQAILTILDAGLSAYSVCFIAGVYLALLSGILRKTVSGNGALDTVAGLAYPCSLFSALMVIGTSDIWFETFVLAMLSTWICDTFAMLGGMRFGKHKLAPAVSPNKTWEGAICGAVSSVFTGILVWGLGLLCADLPWLGGLYSPLPLAVCVVTAVLASSLGQIGDLAESLIKRMIGVKDFSNLIPGHGGMFDRADSLLFAIPTAYFCIRVASMIMKGM